VDDDWSGVQRRHRLDASHEEQQRRRVIWDSVVRPGRELELSDFTLLRRSVLHQHQLQRILNNELNPYFIKSGPQAVAWYSGRTLVFDRRTFPVLRSTCS